MTTVEDGDDAEKGEEENDDEGDETVAGNALLVSHRAKTLDASSGKIADQPRIGRGLSWMVRSTRL